MCKDEKLQMIEEIKRVERELYLKRSRLTSAESMEGISDCGVDLQRWEALIDDIGRHSTGGDSVRDIGTERRG